jgi:ammonium transporter, Amt family
VHMVGGLVGALLTGIFSTAAINEFGADGLIAGGGFELLGKQFVAVGVTLAFSLVLSLAIAKLVDVTIGFRLSEEDEITGLDLTQHSEVGYALSEGSGLSMSHSPPPPAPAPAPAHATNAVHVTQGGEA